ncbi:hypothetical protein D9M71_318400 [compost metagenome]
MQNDANGRINGYWERIALFALSSILALTVWAFQEQSKRVEKLEATTLVLQTSKVDKGDLRDVEDRINSKIDGMKSDILGRLEWYFGRLPKDK